jgi:hypothetical protein
MANEPKSMVKPSARMKAFINWTKEHPATWPLGTVIFNGKFKKFFDPDTDTAWMGFQAGWNARKLDAISDIEPLIIKRLEWNPYRAETPFGYYHIDDQTDRSEKELHGRPPFLLSGTRIDLQRFWSIEQAQAAAQAHFNACFWEMIEPSIHRIQGKISLQEHAALLNTQEKNEQPKHYRFLELDEIIEIADEFLADDTVTWTQVSPNSPSVGKKYSRGYKPMRRAYQTPSISK